MVLVLFAEYILLDNYSSMKYIYISIDFLEIKIIKLHYY